MSDPTRGAEWNQDQFPCGESRYDTSSQTELQFTNYLHDSESDDEYAYAREYVNRLARFETLDPLAGSIGEPMSLNRYTDSLDNPINLGDPTGLDPQPPPGPWAGAVNPDGEYGACTLNGVYVSCGFAQQAYANGSASQCLNADCSLYAESSVKGNTVYQLHVSRDIQFVGTRYPGGYTSWVLTHDWVSVVGSNGGMAVQAGVFDLTPYDKWVGTVYDQRARALANAVVAKAGYLNDWQFWAEWAGVTWGTGAGGAVAADLAAGPEESVLFGRFSPVSGGFKGYLNSFGGLRIGYGWNGPLGMTVFRIGGTVVGWIANNPHLDLWPPEAWRWPW